MRISTKLIGITLGSAVIVSGLVMSLVVENNRVSVSYADILVGPARQAAEARQVQNEFREQVQDWNEILLRGENPQDLAKYTAQFHAQEAKVKSETWKLANTVNDPATKQRLNDFLIADDSRSVKYQAAYGVYLKQRFNFRAADTLVRGRTEAPANTSARQWCS
jgi:methyl-accepting chemotaxis protein